MNPEGKRGRRNIQTTLTPGTPEELQGVRLNELNIWLGVREWWRDYISLRAKERFGRPLISEEAALVSTFDAYAFQLHLSALSLEHNIAEQAVRRASTWFRQCTYLQKMGILRTVPQGARILNMGCGYGLSDAAPFIYQVKNIKPRELVDFDKKGPEATAEANVHVDGRRAILEYPSLGISQLVKQDNAIIGIDPDSSQIEVGKRIFHALGVQINTRQGMALDYLGQTRQKFDLITAIRMDPRMVTHPTEFCRSIQEHLTPQGQALVTIGGGRTERERAERIAAFNSIGASWRGAERITQQNALSAGCENWTNGAYMDIACLVLR